jgi:hypothetical protein
MRRLSRKEKVPFKRSRWLLLKNPWNLSDERMHFADYASASPFVLTTFAYAKIKPQTPEWFQNLGELTPSTRLIGKANHSTCRSAVESNLLQRNS